MSAVSGIFPGETDAPVDKGVGFVDDGGTGAGAQDPGGKFLLIGVNHFDSAATMSSYLRLGAAAAGAGVPVDPSPTGEDLASLVQGFVDDDRDRGATPLRAGVSGSPSSVSTSLSPAQSMNGGVDEAHRRTESSRERLHGKGGWRDHTDGNRVTTTRGDKVEVIGGNYKLVVLGRQDTTNITDNDRRRRLLQNATGFDMSGGLEDDASRDLPVPTPGLGAGVQLEVEYRWVQDTDGSWAWTQNTTVGAESPSHYGNRKIVNRTWVDYLDEQLGSEAKRVPFVNSAVWAERTTTEVHVSGINDNLTAGHVTQSITTVDFVNDVTVTIASIESKLIGVILEADFGCLALMQCAAVMPTILSPLVIDEFVGVHVDNHLGAHSEFTTGVHTETILGDHMDTHVGVHMDSHIGEHVEIEGDKLKLNGQEIGDYTGPRVEVNNAHALTLVNTQLRVYGLSACFATEQCDIV